MITVEKVLNKSAEQTKEALAGPKEKKEKRGSYTPWIILGLGALAVGGYFLFRGSGNKAGNEGISS